MAELLRGTLWLESKEGKGSIFYFTIPIRQNINNTQFNQGLYPLAWAKILFFFMFQKFFFLQKILFVEIENQ